ncbi:MAG: threonine synthase, partial [Pseudomonadales bacterium]|nr:threonine synthase [Pseudomonadales bacterium]
MRYLSTRGGCAPLSFTQAVLTGLAPDGGLLVPERFPDVADRLDAWRTLSYVELTQRIFRLYADGADGADGADDIPGDDLDAIVADAFAAFDHPDIAPLVDLGEIRILELFHGPTLSFKDIALQILGRLFETILG